jgi:hypothetical protein
MLPKKVIKTFDFEWLNFRFHLQAKSWEIFNIFRRSDSDSAIRATSSAYIRAFIILDERETPMFSFSSISERFFIKIENRVGERIHRYLGNEKN